MPVLEHTIGKMHFSWVEGSDQIEVYRVGVSGMPEKRFGFLTTERDEEQIPFEQEAFEAQCEWFVEIASLAETPTLDGRYDIQRISGGSLVQSFDGMDHEFTTGVVNMVWGSIPDSLETGGDEDEEWKLHLGGAEWVIVRRVS